MTFKCTDFFLFAGSTDKWALVSSTNFPPFISSLRFHSSGFRNNKKMRSDIFLTEKLWKLWKLWKHLLISLYFDSKSECPLKFSCTLLYLLEWRLAANILNKQSWTADQEWSSSLRFGREAATSHYKNHFWSKTSRMKNWITLKYLVKNQHFLEDAIKCRIKVGNSCYFSVQTIMSSRLLSKILKIKYIKQ